MLRGEVKTIPNDRREAIKDFLKILESFLMKSEWFAGDEVTIADFSYLANVATIKVNADFFFCDERKGCCGLFREMIVW